MGAGSSCAPHLPVPHISAAQDSRHTTASLEPCWSEVPSSPSLTALAADEQAKIRYQGEQPHCRQHEFAAVA